MNIKVEIKGLAPLIRNFNNAPAIIDKEIELSFRKSLALVERNVKMRTPVDTGRLRASIGAEGSQGWKYIKKTMASIGTRVRYALWVELIPMRHAVGQVGYFSEGVKASMEGINNFFRQAIENVALKITKK